MSRMDRVKVAISSTASELSKKIEDSQKAGKLPADYSLGFANGILFCNHHLQGIAGQPKFYDRTTSIGKLPKPIALNSGDPIKDTFSHQLLLDSVLLKARVLVEALAVTEDEKGVEFTVSDVGHLLELRRAIQQMDEFVSGQKEMAAIRKANDG